MKVVIIDYQMSNMFSVKNALDKVGIKNCISSDPNVLIEADGAILPGVGSFCEAMAKINDLKLNEAIINFIDSKRPFMGICLGLQLLFSESLEFKKTKGLNIIQGLVKKIESKQNNLKVPHVGWNKVKFGQENKINFFNENFFYFVHSFHVEPINGKLINSTTQYGDLNICSSILKENIFACQFHPEKSGLEGIKIFENFFLKNGQ